MDPTLAEPKVALIRKRATFKKNLRQLLDQKGLIEVDVPCLGDEACPDISSPALSFFHKNSQQLHLAPSPEYFIKRLIAQAPGDYYSLAPCFRDDPITKYHNPEFLMLEFYLMGSKFLEMKELTARVIEIFINFSQVEELSYQDLFHQYASIFPNGDKNIYAKKLTSHQIDFNPSWSSEILEDLIFSTFCQSHLGLNKLTLVSDFPEHHSALAKYCPLKKTAQRVEFFINGIEVANGYDECICSRENAKRIAQWEKQWSERAPKSDKFLASISQLPPCSGVAIGFDRLVQLSLKKDNLADTLLFPWVFENQKVNI